jgi:hypothetical protein
MNRNWEEDAYKPEGQSLNHCNYCFQTFIGRPSRVFCKLCTTEIELKKASEK